MGVDECIIISTGIIYYGKDYPLPGKDLEDYELEQFFIRDAYDEDSPTFFALNPEHLNVCQRSRLKCSGITWSVTPFKDDIYDLSKIIDSFKEYIIDSLYRDYIHRGDYRDIPTETIKRYIDEVGDFIRKQEQTDKLHYGKFLYRYFN